MSKKQTTDTPSDYEVIDEAKIRETVERFVDFAEKENMPAKLVMVAMEIIVDKIKTHLGLETVTVRTKSDKIH